MSSSKTKALRELIDLQDDYFDTGEKRQAAINDAELAAIEAPFLERLRGADPAVREAFDIWQARHTGVRWAAPMKH